jgi:Spy/CpxP family protein refolding chaperone
MRTFVRLISVCSVVSLGLAAPAIASAHPVDQQEEEDVASTSEALHGGAKHLWQDALDAVDLRPDQKDAVDKLKSDAKERHAPVKAAKGELMMAVADQIEDGDINRCELDSQVEKVAKAMAKARPGDRDAMEKLHSILDPEQRGRFVDALKQGWEKHKSKHSPKALVEKMDKDLHLTGKQKENLEQIFTALREIREAEPGHAEHKERWRKILEAFKGDHFDLDEVAPMGDVMEKSKKKIEGRLWAAEAVIPVLDEEQRKVVAEKIRDKAKKHTATESGHAKEVETEEED